MDATDASREWHAFQHQVRAGRRPCGSSHRTERARLNGRCDLLPAIGRATQRANSDAHGRIRARLALRRLLDRIADSQEVGGTVEINPAQGFPSTGAGAGVGQLSPSQAATGCERITATRAIADNAKARILEFILMLHLII